MSCCGRWFGIGGTWSGKVAHEGYSHFCGVASGRPRAATYNREKTELATEQMFDIITLGSLPGVILLNS